MKMIHIFLLSLLLFSLFAKAQTPIFDDGDIQKPKISIKLTKIVGGFQEPTAIAFHPEDDDIMIVLEEAGMLKWFSQKFKTSGILAQLSVPTRSEEGLLGIDFHPKFSQNRKFYLNYIVKNGNQNKTRIAEWQWPAGALNKITLRETRTLLEIDQPFSNHNGGSLVFGTDGLLYIGMGDGGKAGDPFGHGQNPNTLLGKMLRIDVDGPWPYGIPRDNPFASGGGAKEIYAMGLRNPWKYSFAQDGRLVVADVGQNKLEEISIVEKGKNYGWNIMEADSCFSNKKDCQRSDLVPPVYSYGRSDGVSITGGYEYTGSSVAALKNKWLFGDFVTGRIWALDLSGSYAVSALGRFSISISTFGRNRQGEIYVADFRDGTIYRIS